jgi:hypothetical protein
MDQMLSTVAKQVVLVRVDEALSHLVRTAAAIDKRSTGATKPSTDEKSLFVLLLAEAFWNPRPMARMA